MQPSAVRSLMRDARLRTLLLDALCVLPGIWTAAAFAFRRGVPGFRHDWLWPAKSSTFVRWALDSGLSQWNPHGLGSGGQAPTINVVLMFPALMGLLHFPSTTILFALFSLVFCGSAIGFVRCVQAFDITLDPVTTRLLAIEYALSPVCFQKSVAGHLAWLIAYAALPWFVTNVRLGCAQAEGSRRHFAAAALLFAIASTQIQFLLFDTIVLLCVVAPFARQKRAWLGSALVLCVGILHNTMWLIIPLAPVYGFNPVPLHATLIWENGMSGFPLPLWTFPGYQHYDDLSLASWATVPFLLGRWALAIAATLALVLRPDRRTITFAAIAAFALAVAAGLHGPLAPLLNVAIVRYDPFLLVREFFHAMALYALAAAMLAALTLSRVQPRALRIGIAVLFLPCILPFATGGLVGLVPDVTPDRNENEADFYLPHLRALMPFQEPIGVPSEPSFGADPARFADDVVTTGNTPLYAYDFVWKGAGSNIPVLADLGISVVASRPNRESKISTSFEPHVGAHFEGFKERAARLQQTFGPRTTIPGARSLLQLETSDSQELARRVADIELPRGREVSIESSHVGNDIDREWVSGHLWMWLDPSLADLVADPVVTDSDAPLVVPAGLKTGESLYVLARGSRFTLDGSPPDAVIGTDVEDYRWWRWDARDSTAAVSLAPGGRGLSSVAHAIVAESRGWRPTQRTRVHGFATADSPPYSASVPWKITLELPALSATRTLVFARSFSTGWHLFVDGRDMGPSRRADRVFNGWTVGPSNAPARASLQFVPQRLVNGVLVTTAVIEGSLLVMTLVPFRRRRPPARAEYE
jgi:hypothetical protein